MIAEFEMPNGEMVYVVAKNVAYVESVLPLQAGLQDPPSTVATGRTTIHFIGGGNVQVTHPPADVAERLREMLEGRADAQ